MNRQIVWLLLLLLRVGAPCAIADEPGTAPVSFGVDEKVDESQGFGFIRDRMLPCTSVKDQARTSTCWCFATNSFLEAELIRKGHGKIDLSEMFVVRHIYPMKAERYIRRHGKAQFAAGDITLGGNYAAGTVGVIIGMYVVVIEEQL